MIPKNWISLTVAGILVMFVGTSMRYFYPEKYVPGENNPAVTPSIVMIDLPPSSGIKQAIDLAKQKTAENEASEKQLRTVSERLRKALEREKKAGEVANRLGISYPSFIYLGRPYDHTTTNRIIERMKLRGTLFTYTNAECIRDKNIIIDSCMYETFLLDRVAKDSALKETVSTAHAHGVQTKLALGSFRVETSTLTIDVAEDDNTIITFILKDSTPYLKK